MTIGRLPSGLLSSFTQTLSRTLFTLEMESIFSPALGLLCIILTVFTLSKKLCQFEKLQPFLLWLNIKFYIENNFFNATLKRFWTQISEDLFFWEAIDVIIITVAFFQKNEVWIFTWHYCFKLLTGMNKFLIYVRLYRYRYRCIVAHMHIHTHSPNMHNVMSESTEMSINEGDIFHQTTDPM